MNSYDNILWAGDINSDFSRNTNHTHAVQEALEELGLQRSWNQFEVDFTYTHDLLGQTFTSLLDHFFWNSDFSSSVTDAGVLHLPGNMSDHSPIFCTFDSSLFQELLTDPVKTSPRPSWKRASSEEKSSYMTSLKDRLSKLTIPDSVTSCTNVHCKQASHREDLDQYTLGVLEAVQQVAEDVLPVLALSSRGRVRSVRPGWSS